MQTSIIQELGTKRRFMDESVEEVKKVANTGTDMCVGVSIEDLPYDILIFLFENHMGNFTVKLCSLVCRRWREVILGGWKSLKLFGWDYQLVDSGFEEGQGALVQRLFDSPGFSGIEIIRSGGVSLSNFEISAAEHGSIDFLRVRTYNEKQLDTLARLTAKGGNMHCLKYLVEERGCRMSETLLAGAAYSGNIEMLDYLKDRRCPWDVLAYHHAVSGGHTEILLYLCETYGGVGLDYAHLYAVQGGSLICLKYLHERQDRPYFNPSMYELAIRGGHMDVLCYLFESNCPLGDAGYDGLYAKAVRNKQLACLRYLHEKRPENNFTSDLCWTAIEVGNIEILKYLHESGCPWDNLPLRRATMIATTTHPRQQACLAYALAHGCPDDGGDASEDECGGMGDY